jgi:hypothetical protein
LGHVYLDDEVWNAGVRDERQATYVGGKMMGRGHDNGKVEGRFANCGGLIGRLRVFRVSACEAATGKGYAPAGFMGCVVGFGEKEDV